MVARRRAVRIHSSVEGQAAVEIYIVRPDGTGLQRLRRESKRSYRLQYVRSSR
jgi:hypothetical protein